MSVVRLFAAGGLVMYPLLGCAIATIALSVERSLFWWRLKRQQPPLARDVLTLYQRDDREAANRLRRDRHLPLAQIFLAAMLLDDPSPEAFRLALDSAAQAQLPLLKRFGSAFETIANVAPLLGLLGTILGLMQAFSSLGLGEPSAGDTAAVTLGISEALVSTAAGLTVAISALVAANTFRSLYRRQLAAIAAWGGQLELLYRRTYERKPTIDAIP